MRAIVFTSLIRRFKKALTIWRKETYGDIFKYILIREETKKIKKQLFNDVLDAENRMVMHQAQAELKKYWHYEEEFWRQKASIT